MSTQSSAPMASKEYQQTNRWLQDMARKAGAGKALWPPKPSVGNATEIVNAFLSYQKMTTGVLEQFMDSYLQFEKAGRIFHTEHAFTQAVLNDSASRAVDMPDRNMVAFVSTSARAVSSDALFLRMTLDALDADAYGNEFAPNATASVQVASSAHQGSSISAQGGIGASFLSAFRASVNASAEIRNERQSVTQLQVTGKPAPDAGDRQALSCLSAIYALEQTGVLPERRMMNTLIRLSEIKRAVALQIDGYEAARDICCDTPRSIDPINDALRMEKKIGNFLTRFAKDRRMESADSDRDAHDFWGSVIGFAANGNLPANGWMDRHVDHIDQPEPAMALSLLRMADILQKSRKDAMAALRPVLANGPRFGHGSLVDGQTLTSIAVSPIFGPSAVMVITNDNGRSSPMFASVKELSELFPEFKPLLQQGMTEGSLVMKSDAWESAIATAKQATMCLEKIIDSGMVPVVTTDIHGQRCLSSRPETSLDDELSSDASLWI